MDYFKLSSLNANGLRLAPKRKALFSKFHKDETDFVFLQETHTTPQDEKIWLSQWNGHGIFAHGRSNSRGVSILLKQGTKPEILHSIIDPNGRFILIQLKRDNEEITLLNVYAPTQSEADNQLTFINSIHEMLGQLQIHTLIMAGDFNVQMSPNNTGSSSAALKYEDQICYLLEDYLVDIWKEKNPHSKKGTFHRGQYFARLDYIFIPQYPSPSISTTTINPEPLSDHSRIEIEVNLPTNKRGKGYWRFNNYWLSDTDFVQKMKEHIGITKEQELSNPNLRWEWVKYKIREFSISYTIQQAREQRAWIAKIEKKLSHLADHPELLTNTEIATEMASLKRELAEIEKHKANKALFKSRANWLQLGERPTAYFLGLEKRMHKDKTITSIKDEKNHTLYDNAEILAYEKRFFANIHRRRGFLGTTGENEDFKGGCTTDI